LIIAVSCAAALLVAAGQQLTILHLVGMLLIVAVGSNYALFFDRAQTGAERAQAGLDPLTIAALAIANLATVTGFGLLSFSQVPVLEALGTSVAPGAFFALIFSALLASRGARA
jgi:predicted exporter